MSLTIIYSTRLENPVFKKQLLDSCYNKDVQIIEIVNNGQYSLSKAYNIGIEQAINDIIICCHDDIILSKNFDKALLKDFKENPEAGIIGKAGSIKIPSSGIFWEEMNVTMCGHVFHQLGDEKKYLSSYSSKINGIIPVITVDGLFISFNKKKIKDNFDEYFDGFHFYDHSFCLNNGLKGVGIFVTFSFEITHRSAGETNSSFDYNRLKFIKKYNDVLPIEIPKKKIFVNSKNPIIPSKKQEKISIIIPHIHNNPILFVCIDSLIKSTTYTNYEIIIADTGSNEDTINEIKNKYKDNSKIKLIQYSYYNFAKINNDVVTNHLSADSKFILFLNNDVEFFPDNDALSRLYEVLISKNNIFSTGGRLYFSENGAIQHSGHLPYIKDNQFQITHYGLNSFYTYHTTNKNVSGNTGALLLCRRNIFEKLGMFVETTECFEDVLLTLKALTVGYLNVFVADSICLHKESQTRGQNPDMLKKLQYDYQEFLAPFIKENFEKLKGYIYQM